MAPPPWCDCSMPSRIDRGQRVEHVGRVVLRLVADEGIGAVTYRQTAAAAGLPVQALRHLWPTQERLLLSGLVQLRREWRSQSWPMYDEATGPDVWLQASIRQLLPLDDEAAVRARALTAYSGDARSGSRVSAHLREYERDRMALIERIAHQALWLANPERSGGYTWTASAFADWDPDKFTPPTISLLALVNGLTRLIIQPGAPLAAETVERWVSQFGPGLLDCMA
jgi:AcrR family transcriptional regulator